MVSGGCVCSTFYFLLNTYSADRRRCSAGFVREEFRHVVTYCSNDTWASRWRARFRTFAGSAMRAHSRGRQKQRHGVSALRAKVLTPDASTIGASWQFRYYVNIHYLRYREVGRLPRQCRGWKCRNRSVGTAGNTRKGLEHGNASSPCATLSSACRHFRRATLRHKSI